MKKKIYSLLLAAIMVFSLITTAFAAEGSDTTVIDCGDGYFLHVTTTEYTPNITTRTIYQKSATVQAKAYHGNIYIGTYYLNGTFQYDTVQAKATADSWSASSSYGYSGNSSHSGAKVSGYCTFDYAGGKTYRLSMTCDKNGNITRAE